MAVSCQRRDREIVVGVLAMAACQAAFAQTRIDLLDCLRAKPPRNQTELIVSAAPTRVGQLRKVLHSAKLACAAQLQMDGACLLQVKPRSGESPTELARKLSVNIFALDNRVAPPDVQAAIGNVVVNERADRPTSEESREESPQHSRNAARAGSRRNARLVCDPLFDLQMELKAIGAETAWFDAQDRPDIITAILDTGVQRDHEDLVDQILDGKTMGCLHLNCDGRPIKGLPGDGHGTKVAGILAADRCNQRGVVGVAWNTRIVSFNYGVHIDDFRLSCGIQYALAKKASIINLSAEGLPKQLPQATAYLQAAESLGVLFVGAAGNNHVNLEERKLYPLSTGLPNVLGVMGFAQGADEAASAPDPVSNFGKATIHIAAPHSSGRTTKFCAADINCYVKTVSTGTSWSTAYVSGAAALLKSRYPDVSYDFLKWRIIANAKKDVRLNDLSVSGGRLDLARTIFPVTAAGNAVSRSSKTPIDWSTGIRETACAQVSIEGRFVIGQSPGPYFSLVASTPNQGAGDVIHTAMPQGAAQAIQLRVKCISGMDIAESRPLPLR